MVTLYNTFLLQKYRNKYTNRLVRRFLHSKEALPLNEFVPSIIKALYFEKFFQKTDPSN